MKKVIEFIMEQKLTDISGLPNLIEPLKEKFKIKKVKKLLKN